MDIYVDNIIDIIKDKCMYIQGHFQIFCDKYC